MPIDTDQLVRRITRMALTESAAETRLRDDAWLEAKADEALAASLDAGGDFEEESASLRVFCIKLGEELHQLHPSPAQGWNPYYSINEVDVVEPVDEEIINALTRGSLSRP
jgi:hypothetical protein